MAQPAKFGFDTVFDGLVDDGSGYEEEKEPTWTAEELEAEKARSFAEGRKAGREDALAGIEEQISQTIGQVLTQSGSTLARLNAVEDTLRGEAKLLALALGRSIASDLLVRNNLEVIEQIVEEALGFLSREPHVVIRVHRDLLDGVESRFEQVAEAKGFDGKLILLGEPDYDLADCRVEWADGGITRDASALAIQLDEIVKRHFSAGDAEPDQHDLFKDIGRPPPVGEDTTEENMP